ncbi:MAG: class I SAM-dependent methyltransferase [Spirochaetales bacterium]|nr:class I SAM-dependent methyltransferase [Spirochaetales bacterium]
MDNFKEHIDDSINRWESNAAFWDDYMGDKSNQFHRELIRPFTETLLGNVTQHSILDIACGNGNFSRRLAELGAKVLAFDSSQTMIDRAIKRSDHFIKHIEYKVIDATDYNALVNLGVSNFHAAVSNMGLMDIADINPVISALTKLLKPSGSFVFSIVHPCFQTPGMKKYVEQEEVDNQIVARSCIMTYKYLQSESHFGVGIRNQPIATRYFHRSLSALLKLCFEKGFVLDALEEPSFKQNDHPGTFEWTDIPPVIIFRLKKQA